MWMCEALREAMVPSSLNYQNRSSIGTPGTRMSGCSAAMPGHLAFSPETMTSAVSRNSFMLSKCSRFKLWQSKICILQATHICRAAFTGQLMLQIMFDKVWGDRPATHHIPHRAYPHMHICIILPITGDAPTDKEGIMHIH